MSFQCCVNTFVNFGNEQLLVSLISSASLVYSEIEIIRSQNYIKHIYVSVCHCCEFV